MTSRFRAVLSSEALVQRRNYLALSGGVIGFEHTIAGPLIELEVEHGLFMRECAILETMVKKLNGKRNGKPQVPREVISIVGRLEASLTNHMSREEELLLPIMREHLGQEVMNSFTQEHTRISRTLQELREAATHISGKSLGLLAILVTKLDSLLWGHFLREENVLFWYESLFFSPREYDMERHGVKIHCNSP